MITSCEEDAIVTNVNESVVKLESFVASDYYVANNPNSLGAIFVDNAAQWKIGDKIRVSGSIKFKRPNESRYVTNQYTSSGNIRFVTERAIYVGYDYAGINISSGNSPTHVELHQGTVELLRLLPGNGG